MKIAFKYVYAFSFFIVMIFIILSCEKPQKKIIATEIKGTWYLNKWTSYHTLTFDDSTVWVSNNTDTVFRLKYNTSNDLLKTWTEEDKINANEIIELTKDKLLIKGINDVKEERLYTRTQKPFE